MKSTKCIVSIIFMIYANIAMADWEQMYHNFRNGPNKGCLLTSLIIKANFIIGDESGNFPLDKTNVPENWKTQAREVINSYDRAKQYIEQVVHNQLPFNQEIEIEEFTFKAQIYAGRFLVDITRPQVDYLFITLGVKPDVNYTQLRDNETNEGYFLQGTNGTEEDCRRATSILHRYLDGRLYEELEDP
ncbi:MAG: hypothetical protein AB8G05_14975 [Oligoflexales bacterium]